MIKPFFKKKQLVLKDIDTALLLEHGEALGWEEKTPIDLLIEPETASLIISRHSPFCCVCGGGSFKYMLHKGDKNICEACASDISQILVRYDHNKYGDPQNNETEDGEKQVCKATKDMHILLPAWIIEIMGEKLKVDYQTHRRSILISKMEDKYFAGIETKLIERRILLLPDTIRKRMKLIPGEILDCQYIESGDYAIINRVSE